MLFYARLATAFALVALPVGVIGYLIVADPATTILAACCGFAIGYYFHS